MTLLNYPDVLQGSDEWHDQRRGMVTASVVGQLITADPPDAETVTCPSCGVKTGPCVSLARKTPTLLKTVHSERLADASSLPPEYRPAQNETSRALTMLLAAERITGHTDPTYMNADMWRGVEDEPRAVDKYREHHAPVDVTGFMVEDKWGFQIGYSPDGLVGDDGLIEVKSRRQKKHLQTILADTVPPENMAQLQCGLLVTGREWIDYISYCGGMPLWVKRVTPDHKWFAAIIAAVTTFEENVAAILERYTPAVEGLPMTERIDPDMEII